MGYTLAICGKGGTGKTTVSSLIINWLAKNKKGKILAVDADPNSNLALNLGLDAKVNIGEMVDEISKNPSQIPQGMSKQEFLEYKIQTELLESEGFDLLVMGRPEGPGCYCYVNNVLRDTIKKIADSYDFIVIDNEAGLEHFSRRTTRKADSIIIVSDNSATGLRSAKRIYNLINELDIKVKERFLLVNKSSDDIDVKEQIGDIDIKYLDSIPEDNDVKELSIKGEALTSLKNGSTAVKSIERICKKLWQ